MPRHPSRSTKRTVPLDVRAWRDDTASHRNHPYRFHRSCRARPPAMYRAWRPTRPAVTRASARAGLQQHVHRYLLRIASGWSMAPPARDFPRVGAVLAPGLPRGVRAEDVGGLEVPHVLAISYFTRRPSPLGKVRWALRTVGSPAIAYLELILRDSALHGCRGAVARTCG